MSAIYTDAADIPTALPHPTGAATVINFNCVIPPFYTTTPSPTAPASTSPSSPSASDCYYSDPSSSSSSSFSSSSSSSSVSDSRLESRDSSLPPSRDSQLPPPRDLSLEAHQAEYRAHAYLANVAILATKLAADKFLQNLFKTQTEPDKDILRAASAASSARLQNPFAYNRTGSSGSSGSSSGFSGSSSSSSGSSGSSGPSYPRSPSSPSGTSNPSAPAAVNPPIAANPPAPARPAATSSTKPAPAQVQVPAASSPELDNAINPAEVDAPLTEADFTGCIKLDDATSDLASTGAQYNPVENVATRTPAALSGLVIWPFGHLTISPPARPPPPSNLASFPATKWPAGP